MAIGEVRVRLRRKLEEAFGVDEAALLMDRPPGGDEFEKRIDLKFDALEHKLTAAVEAGFRAQTWRLVTALIAAMGVQTAALGMIVALAGP